MERCEPGAAVALRVLLAFLLPWLALGVLVCNFSPLQSRDKPSVNSTTQCLPHQGCFSCRGRYGSVHVLSAQGCVARSLCGSFRLIKYRGISINATYTCCCRDRCNDPPAPEMVMERLFGVTIAPEQDSTPTNATPDPRDLCPGESTAVPTKML